MKPRAIAVIGAGPDKARINGRPLRYLREFGFAGELYAVNPNYRDIDGIPCVPDIASLPDNLDLAVCMLSSAHVLTTAQACAKKGVGALVVMAAGFAEAGPEGKAAQDKLADIGRTTGMRILGPNTLGYRDQNRGIFATFATDLDSGRRKGNVAIITQSGGLGGYFGGAKLREMGIGTGYLIDTGNEADLDAAECLAAVCKDPDVSVVGLILEGCRSGRKLLDSCLAARERNIPVVLLKVGVSAAGTQSVALHTGSLAGEIAVWDAALQAAGVLRARDEAQFVNLLQILDTGRLPRGKGVGILTLSGGAATVMLDACEAFGLSVPPIRAGDPALQAKMPLVHFGNPLDASGQMANTPDLLDPLLRHVLSHDDIHVAVIWLAYALMSPTVGPPMMRAVIEGAKNSDKPVIIAGMSTPQARDELRKAGVIVTENPTLALEALAACIAFQKPPAMQRPVREWIAPTATSERVLTGPAAQAVLEGVPFAATVEVSSQQDAARAANELGFPVVMKIEAEGLVHKSELGVIKLGLQDEGAVTKAFDDLKGALAQHNLKGGIFCQSQISGLEVFAGAKRDAVFGPIVMVGLGGIFVELLSDVAILLAPATKADVLAALQKLKGYPILKGARGRALVDLDALAGIVERLSRLMTTNAAIIEVDINPIILPAGKAAGAYAVDAVVRVAN